MKMQPKIYRLSALLGGMLLLSYIVHAQALKPVKTDELQLALKKLRVLGSVLYIAAHPDDENTRLIAYLAKHKHYETAYLSLTRGDGGQNLIGSEQGYLLGVIRTQELLAARRIDGGKQFFTTANDFGFSRNPTETMLLWDSTRVLADMVWVIRRFRPDVLITRFPTDGSGGHGHHTASALLAEVAFQAAANPNLFPEQLQYVTVWQPKRLLWNKWRGVNDTAKVDERELLAMDVGTYNPLLGESYYDIAMDSRSQHKSQGFGAAKERGTRMEYVQHIIGERAQQDLFDNINTSWTRIRGGEKIGRLIDQAIAQFHPENPSAIVPLLLQAYRLLDTWQPTNADERHWVGIKKEEVKEVIRQCAGLWFEIVAEDYSAVAGDSIHTTTTVINRSPLPFQWRIYDVEFAQAFDPSQAGKPNQSILLANNIPQIVKAKYRLSEKLAISQPYWLTKPLYKGMYRVEDWQLVGLPETPPQHTVLFGVELNGVLLTYRIPMMYKWTHRVDGERYRPFAIVPAVTANIQDKVYVFSDRTPKEVKLILKAGRNHASGNVSLMLPPGWSSEPQSINFTLAMKEEEKTVSFQLLPPQESCTAEIGVLVNGERAYSYEEINYPHIPIQMLFPQASAKVVKLDIQTKGKLIGYYEGAGDEIPASLRQIGYQVIPLTDDNFDNTNLSQFDAIITGVRAYNARPRIKFHSPKLLEYVEKGGTLIVQYNVSFGLGTQQIGPYPFRISRERVTLEDAPVTFLAPHHPLLNSPNKITQEDFKDWIQERGLYFADRWDEKYQTVISCADPGSEQLQGGLLFAQYGKGAFIYTGYAFFRQLPAGVPGAYRLFTNLISYGK
ncbi:MAG: PIG-L family deacetylase [Cytophagales bacterium]|nr:PIG-L family deacetylase [Bernardetiaceae bacterium]MDW8204562.1 PIG-L family deacetylase [Cytophagales bacterium]